MQREEVPIQARVFWSSAESLGWEGLVYCLVIKELYTSITTPRKTVCKCVWCAVPWENSVGKGHSCWAQLIKQQSCFLPHHQLLACKTPLFRGGESMPDGWGTWANPWARKRRQEGLKTLSFWALTVQLNLTGNGGACTRTGSKEETEVRLVLRYQFRPDLEFQV